MAYIFLLGILVGVIVIITKHTTKKPSLTKNWSKDQSVLPHIQIDSDQVVIQNIRKCHYQSKQSYDVTYYNSTFSLNSLTNVYYVVEPFLPISGIAHTFLIFEYNHAEYIGVSVEIRRTVGERFSVIRGLGKTYELMYVIADEHDLLSLRAVHRKHKLYMYPLNLSQEEMKGIFYEVAKRVNTLETNPEFYNSITNNCMTNIVAVLHKVTPTKIGQSLLFLLPEYSDKVLYRKNMLRTNTPPQDLRTKHRIDDLVIQHEHSSQFSTNIRARFADEINL